MKMAAMLDLSQDGHRWYPMDPLTIMGPIGFPPWWTSFYQLAALLFAGNLTQFIIVNADVNPA